MLLPKLHRRYEQSNVDVTERQHKIVNILKSEKMRTSPSKRSIGYSSSIKQYGRAFNTDLENVSEVSPLNTNKKGLFLTDVSQKERETDLGRYRNDSSPKIEISKNSIKNRKRSHKPKSPEPVLDFLSRQ